MPLAFEDKVVLVTGVAQGIGRAIAREFKDGGGGGGGGATVHVCDIDEAGVEETARDLDVVPHAADLSDRQAVAAVIGSIEDASGPVDILVNAAGGVRGQVGRPIAEVSVEDWRAIFEANVDSAFWLAQAVGPRMTERGGGRIVFIASGAGLRPSLTGIQAYASAKAGQIGLTRQLAHELGPFGITVNNIAPGFVRSNANTEKQWDSYGPEGQEELISRIALRRLGTPADIAHSVLFLASEYAGWVTGAVLRVDGGR